MDHVAPSKARERLVMSHDKANFVLSLDLPKGWMTAVLLYILARDGRGGCRASRLTIANFFKISERTVDRTLASLKAAGIVSIQRRFHDTSIIRVVLPPE